jgi:RNA polymerase sigma-70 factor (ECF subfamily)
MSSAPAVIVSNLAMQAYSDGYACYGDIDLKLERFESQLRLVIEKHLGASALEAATLRFINTLHTADLYLAIACSQSSDRAWEQFISAYQSYIDKVAWFVSPTSDSARELATSVMADLFMPDRSGHSRIASFDGQQSLATWLRVLMSNRAINLRMLKGNNCEPIERLSDVTDVAAIARMRSALSASKYQDIIDDCFKLASACLTERQQLILLWHYDDGLRLNEIGRVLGVHPTGISRQLHKTHLKLRKKIIFFLTAKHKLSPAAVKECLLDLFDNPHYSLLSYLRVSELNGSEPSS